MLSLPISVMKRNSVKSYLNCLDIRTVKNNNFFSASPQEHRLHRKERKQANQWCYPGWLPVPQMQGLEDIPTGYSHNK